MTPIPHQHVVDKLTRTLDLAADWLDELPRLLPSDNQDATRTWAAPTPDAVADKVVAEIATLAHVALRVTDQSVTERSHHLLAALERHGRPERHRTLMLRAPQFAWPLGIVHAILTAQGSIDADYDAVLTASLATGWNAAVDRPAFRAMEPRWAHGVWRREPPHTDDLWPRDGWSALPAFLARREDAYALTHAVLYSTDFGRYRLPAQAPRPRDLAPVLDSYLADRLWADDMDLVGELALAALCAGAPCRSLTTATSVFFRSWTSDVARGPGVTDTRTLAPDARFARCYHTSLVAGLLAAGLLCLPYPGTIANPRPETVARGALDLLAAAEPEPRELAAPWTVLVDEVPDLPDQVLAMVRDGAVAHACRNLRERALHALLSEGATPEPSLTIRDARTWLALVAALAALGRGAPPPRCARREVPPGLT